MEEKDKVSGDKTTVIQKQSAAEPPAERPTPQLSFDGWDRYRVADFLGEGATSRVYKAFDLTLNRYVALKIILDEDPATEKRFIREARAQAQIDHPHVCKIHEVGTFSGKQYIAMQLIEGDTLGDASRQMTLEQKVVVMQQVADAVHTAHKIGIIHRDIKPSNIMVEKTDTGWHSYVLDFGLAREIAVSGTTMTGMILGTPAFMPPEQAWGDPQKLDRRSDIYSLGATLYYLLSARLPFEGSSMEVIVKLSQDEAVPLRRVEPRVPRDLETIVMKCMERDPNRRYDSAKAQKEDLERFLNGDSIQARPAGFSYRVVKKIKKHKTVAAIAGISTIAILALGGAAIFSWLRASKQVEIAKEFVQIVENMEWRMRVARMAPRHNIVKDKEQVSGSITRIRDRMKAAGTIANGPGNYALGRGFMELSQFKEARVYLQNAWNGGYQSPENAYALGLTLGNLFQQELENAQGIESPSQKKLRMKQLEAEYLKPVLAYLRSSESAEPAMREYIEGLIAYYEKNYPVALKKARNARNKLWWLYEAGKLEGDVYMNLGTQEFEKGNYESAMENYTEAGNAFERAYQVARSEPSLYESDCLRWLQMMKVESERAGSLKKPMDEGLLACDLALEVNPDSATAYASKAQLWWRWCDDLYYRGNYSEEAVDNSIRFAQAAVARDPADFYSQFELGNAYGMKEAIDLSTGHDPNSYGRKAIENYMRAASLKDYWAIYNNQATVLIDLARYAIQHNQDPTPLLKQAIDSCNKASRLAPDSVAAYNTEGTAYIIQGTYERKLGIDDGPAIKHAIDALNKAKHASPNHPTPYLNLATVYADLALHELNHGGNPESAVHASRENAENALKLGGDEYSTGYGIIGYGMLIQAKYNLMHGKETPELFNQSVEYSRKGLKKGSDDLSISYENLIDSSYSVAEYRFRSGLNPLKDLKKAEQAYKEAIAADSDPDLLYWGPRIALLSARWNLHAKESPGQNLNAAIGLANQFLKQNPADARAFGLLAEASEIEAEWLLDQKKPVSNAVNAGLGYARKALDLNPLLVETVAVSGRLSWIRAQAEQDSKLRSESTQQAIDYLRKAIQMNSNLEAKLQPLMAQIH